MNDRPSTSLLADLAARFWRFQCHEFPTMAIGAGEPVPDAVLFREAPQDHARRYAAAGEMLAALDAIALDGLAGEDRATHQLLRAELEDIRNFHDVSAHKRPPMLPRGPEQAIANFANTAGITNAASAALYNDRLATTPAFLRDLIANLQSGHDEGIRYPRIVLNGAVRNARLAISGATEDSPWYGPYKRSVADHDAISAQAARARALIADEVVPALQAYADFLEKGLSDGARDSIACIEAPQGREHYRLLLRQYTTADGTPEQIHELGLSEVARLGAEIEAVAADAGFPGDVAGYRTFLATDPQFVAPSKEALREQVELLSKRIDKKVPVFFGRLPRVTYGFESIGEAASAHMPSAYAQPSPADRTAPGIVWITGLPENCPSHRHVPLILHEGWPGHLMHIALMHELESLPAFRRHGASLKFSACLEGWALYCERLGVEMGLYETPHQHYGRLDMEMYRALRLVVDTGIHWYGWDRERAVDYMAQHQAAPRKSIEAEVDRYIALPGQALAYQIGNLKFRELRLRAEQRLGDGFDLRAFHDVLTATGPVTLAVLEDLVDHWLAQQVPAGAETREFA